LTTYYFADLNAKSLKLWAGIDEARGWVNDSEGEAGKLAHLPADHPDRGQAEAKLARRRRKLDELKAAFEANRQARERFDSECVEMSLRELPAPAAAAAPPPKPESRDAARLRAGGMAPLLG
jgi:hypothetical protein